MIPCVNVTFLATQKVLGWSAGCSKCAERKRKGDESIGARWEPSGRIFPASGHTLHALSLSLFLSLIVSHADSVATGLRIGLTNDQPAA